MFCTSILVYRFYRVTHGNTILFTMNLDFESNRSHTHRTKTQRAHARNAEVLPNLVRNSRILKMDWGGMTGISQIWLAGKSPINAKWQCTWEHHQTKWWWDVVGGFFHKMLGIIGIALGTMQMGTLGIQLGIDLRICERISLLKLLFCGTLLCIDVNLGTQS